MPKIIINISSNDYVDFLAECNSQEMTPEESSIVMKGGDGGDGGGGGYVSSAPETFLHDNKELVGKNLPKVIADKVREMVPDGFELTELSFTGEISGKPFGVGVSGSVTATFKKKDS